MRLLGFDSIPPSPLLSPTAERLICPDSSCGGVPETIRSDGGISHCPTCGAPCAFLLPTEAGWLEPGPALLRGFVPHGASALARGRKPDREVVVLWFQTYRRLREIMDESVRLPESTWRQRGGDALEHALLLADLLLSQGHRVRVVCGHRHGKPHAWVSLEYDGREYLLDLLDGRPARFPPRAEVLAPHYRATVAFDRAACYFPRDPGNPPARCFDTDGWREAAVPPQP